MVAGDYIIGFALVATLFFIAFALGLIKGLWQALLDWYDNRLPRQQRLTLTEADLDSIEQAVKAAIGQSSIKIVEPAKVKRAIKEASE